MKKLFFPSLLFLLIFTRLSGQNFSIGHRTISTTDAARNRTVTMEVYYPADIAGDLVPFTQQPVTAPILVFGHGFVMSWDAYSNLWNTLVPHGYLMAFVTTETGFSPNHLEFGKDIAFTVGHMQSLSADASDLFYQRLDSAAAVMGHSMGGGSAFLSVAFNPSIRAIVTLAAAETSTSAIAAATGIAIPALVIAGANDCVTPPAQHQIPMYNSLASSCKTYVSIVGASHCQMAESNFFCNFGESTCTPPPSISRQTQHQVIDRFLSPWLDSQLRNDCVAGADFDTRITTDATVSYQRTCQLCASTGIAPTTDDSGLRVFLESDMLRLSWKSSTPQRISVYDMSGKQIHDVAVTGDINELSIQTSGWVAGMYQVRLFSTSGTPVSRRVFIQGR